MIIREDFQSASQFLSRLVKFGDAFAENDLKVWPHLRNMEDFDKIYALDEESRMVLERIYMYGRDCAGAMSSFLRSFNDASAHPTLTDFINSFDGGWVYNLEDLRKFSNDAKAKRDVIKLNLFAVDQMVDLFDTQLNLLKATQKTLELLRKSDLHKEENGEPNMGKKTHNIEIKDSPNAQVVVNSNNVELNASIQADKSIFGKIENKINSSAIDETEKKTILRALKEFEDSLGSENAPQKYENFIQSAANHMAIIDTFIPYLSAFIS